MKARRPLEPIREPEQWRKYKDTNFYVSDQGRVKRVIKGKEYEVGFFAKHESKRINTVKISNKNIPIKNIVYELFKGEIPKGYCIVHKTGIHDDSIYNLEAITVKEHGHRVGLHSNSQKVADIDRRIVYRSASEAGRRLHLSRQSICYICRGERKNPIYNLAWYDDENQKFYRGKWRNAEES